MHTQQIVQQSVTQRSVNSGSPYKAKHDQAASVIGMYKFLFENDLNQKMVTAKDKVQLYKDKFGQAQEDITLLKDENVYLQSQIRRY
jgi:hypothetical protein